MYVRALVYHENQELRLNAVIMPDGSVDVLESLHSYAVRVGTPTEPSRRGLAGRQAIARRRAEREQAAAAR
jgi:hypothetical protein